jgi:NTP pyrophosphatase (non-canonical NTP hydrolase)
VLQTQQAEWHQRNFPQDEGKPHRPLLGIVEEAGELAHAHLKAEQGIRGTAADHLGEARDAIGDIVIYLASYCSMTGIDLEEAVWQTWRDVRERDWLRYPTDGRTH